MKNTSNISATMNAPTRTTVGKMWLGVKRALLCGLAALPLAMPLARPTQAQADGLHLAELRITGVADYFDRSNKYNPNYARVLVNNQGTLASTPCKLTYNLYEGINYLQIGDANVPAIAPGQSVYVLIATPVNIHAPHKYLRFTVDALNQVPEFIETNNDYDIDNPY